MTVQLYSLIRNARLRPLPVALAHEVMRKRPGDIERGELLNRLFLTLSPADKLRCRDELSWCRLAKRGEVQAEVA